MLEVAGCVLPAQLRLRPVGLEPGVVVPPVFRARRHAAGRRIPHGASRLRLQSNPKTTVQYLQPAADRAVSVTTTREGEKWGGNANSQTWCKLQTPPVSVIVTRPFLRSLKDAGQHGRSHFPPKKLIKRRGKLINNKNSRTSPFRASRRGQILPLLQVSVHTRLPRLVISVRASSYLHRHIFFFDKLLLHGNEYDCEGVILS